MRAIVAFTVEMSVMGRQFFAIVPIGTSLEKIGETDVYKVTAVPDTFNVYPGDRLVRPGEHITVEEKSFLK